MFHHTCGICRHQQSLMATLYKRNQACITRPLLNKSISISIHNNQSHHIHSTNVHSTAASSKPICTPSPSITVTAVDPLQSIIKLMYKNLLTIAKRIDHDIHTNLYQDIVQYIIMDIQPYNIDGTDSHNNNKSLTHNDQLVMGFCQLLRDINDNKHAHKICWSQLVRSIFHQYHSLPCKVLTKATAFPPSTYQLPVQCTVDQRSDLLSLCIVLYKHFTSNAWQYNMLYKSKWAYTQWKLVLTNDRLPVEHGSIILSALYDTHDDINHSRYIIESHIQQVVDDVMFQITKYEESNKQPLKQYERLVLLNQVLYHEYKYNSYTVGKDDYYTLDSNLLTRVIHNKRSNSVTICALYVAVARRLGLDVVGIKLRNYYMCKLTVSMEEFNEGTVLKNDTKIKKLINDVRSLKQSNTNAGSKQKNMKNNESDTIDSNNISPSNKSLPILCSAVDIFVDVYGGGLLFAKSAVKSDNYESAVKSQRRYSTAQSNAIDSLTHPAKSILLAKSIKSNNNNKQLPPNNNTDGMDRHKTYTGNIDELKYYSSTQLSASPDYVLYSRQLTNLIHYAWEKRQYIIYKFLLKQLDIIDSNGANEIISKLNQRHESIDKSSSDPSSSVTGPKAYGVFLVKLDLSKMVDDDDEDDKD